MRDNREKVGDARCQHRDASRVSRTRQTVESFRSIIADRTLRIIIARCNLPLCLLAPRECHRA